jgi:hypothetical protein
MCNARNHSVNCSCGFGGPGHLGRWSANVLASPLSFKTRNNYVEYVHPNAECPVCGASVFFYQSPNGGRVYFDELGPPWPKHPCTTSASTLPRQANAAPTAQFAWQRAGWSPLLHTQAHTISPTRLKFTGFIADEQITLYVPRLAFDGETNVKQSSFALACHVRRFEEETYEVSVLHASYKAYLMMGYLSQIEAENANDHLRKTKPIEGPKGPVRRTAI